MWVRDEGKELGGSPRASRAIKRPGHISLSKYRAGFRSVQQEVEAWTGGGLRMVTNVRVDDRVSPRVRLTPVRLTVETPPGPPGVA